MKTLLKVLLPLAALSVVLAPTTLSAAQSADWPQWRGSNRDAKATAFNAPESWPAQLSQKWKVTVGTGDATPALVGNKLYLATRLEGREVVLCLDAATGKEVWRDQYEALDATGPAARHSGPRSSPAVADGKVVAYGVRGIVSCLDAQTGKLLWRKDEFSSSLPRFFTASSPLIVGNVCILQLGGENKGAIVAYDLASGNQKWQWNDDGTAYASPAVLTIGDTKTIVALTAKRIVGLALADGKLLWDTPFAPQGRAYNAATPIIEGATVIYGGSGRGTKAVRIESSAAGLTTQELWSNPDQSVQFNTPVLKNAQIYGLAQTGELFCLNAESGKTLWTALLGGRDFGSIVDANTVLLALTPQGELTVFEPNDKEFKKIAAYKVGTDTYSYPVPGANGFYVKDKDSVAFWALQ